MGSFSLLSENVVFSQPWFSDCNGANGKFFNSVLMGRKKAFTTNSEMDTLKCYFTNVLFTNQTLLKTLYMYPLNFEIIEI